MFVEAADVLVAGVTIYQNRSKIAEQFRRLYDYLAEGKKTVVVFGAGGMGKTTLGAILNEHLSPDQKVSPYNESLGTQTFKIVGPTSAVLLVPPGQEARRPAFWGDLIRLLSAGESIHVINVVAWGRQSTGLEKSQHNEFAPGMDDQAFRDAYFDQSMSREILALQDITPFMANVPRKLHMLTLVNKQDLWWEHRHKVSDHYSRGPYSDEIANVLDARGSANFTHQFVSCSLVEQNLLTRDGFTIATTTAGYDDPLRIANLGNVLSAIKQLVEMK